MLSFQLEEEMMKLLILTVFILHVAEPLSCFGKNPPMEPEDLREIFKFIDRDADGNLTKKQVKDFLAPYKFNQTGNNGMYRELNTVGNEVLDLADFIELFNKVESKDKRFWKEMRNAAKLINKKIKVSRINTAAEIFGLKGENVTRHIKQLDLDNDGKIRYVDIFRWAMEKFMAINKEYEQVKAGNTSSNFTHIRTIEALRNKTIKSSYIIKTAQLFRVKEEKIMSEIQELDPDNDGIIKMIDVFLWIQKKMFTSNKTLEDAKTENPSSEDV